MKKERSASVVLQYDKSNPVPVIEDHVIAGPAGQKQTVDAASTAQFGNIAVGSLWFLGTAYFWNGSTPEHKANVAEFFTRFNRPVDFAKEEGAGNDARQQSAVAWLCLAYGAFVSLLALIPNPLVGRLAFLGCGGLVSVIGALLLFSSRSSPTRPSAA